MKAPRRRIEFSIKGGADSWDDLASALKNFSEHIQRGEIRGPNGCSGGYDSGYSYELSEDESVDHESWFSDLEAYLEHRRTVEVSGGR